MQVQTMMRTCYILGQSTVRCKQLQFFKIFSMHYPTAYLQHIWTSLNGVLCTRPFFARFLHKFGSYNCWDLANFLNIVCLRKILFQSYKMYRLAKENALFTSPKPAKSSMSLFQELLNKWHMSKEIRPQTRSNLMMVTFKFFDLLKVLSLKVILANFETLRRVKVWDSAQLKEIICAVLSK